MVPANDPIVRVVELNAWFGGLHAIKNISLDFQPNTVTAIIGPSGCGKSTFIRCLNRLHEEIEGASASGKVYVESTNIYDTGVDPVKIRRKIGMVFQKPNPFPGMSIFDNVAAGLKLAGIRRRSLLQGIVRRSLEHAALWDEVTDKLHHPATSLSGGQQQRLCIARALAVEPSVLLLDEPCSALDPIATARIEELLIQIKDQLTVVIVTHNMQQAARVSEYTVFILMGEMVEYGLTRQMFTKPVDKRTEDYITGRFG